MKCYLKKTCEFLDFQEYFTITKHIKPNAAFSFFTLGLRDLF